jgi:hypothetical protein
MVDGSTGTLVYHCFQSMWKCSWDEIYDRKLYFHWRHSRIRFSEFLRHADNLLNRSYMRFLLRPVFHCPQNRPITPIVGEDGVVSPVNLRMVCNRFRGLGKTLNMYWILRLRRVLEFSPLMTENVSFLCLSQCARPVVVVDFEPVAVVDLAEAFPDFARLMP